jgi:serine/threonine-protein kinase
MTERAEAAGCPRCDVTHSFGSEECPARRIGKVLAGRYRLVRLLGSGAMGDVFEAEHLGLRQSVAIKMMAPVAAENKSAAQRFFREARAAAALDHPSIIRVRHVDFLEDGTPYMEMELLRGQPVSSLIESEPLSVERAVAMAGELLEALACAHAQGIVHRDIKPSNLFWALKGGAERLVVMDFGIAKAQDSLELTTTGTAMGTPCYGSPEQFDDAKRVDARTDLYAVGATLFHLLTGKPPIEDTTGVNAYARIISGDIERHPRKLRPEVPEWLDAVVARSLAYRPDDRFASADEMRRALAEQRAPAPAPPVEEASEPAPRRRIWPWAAAGAAALVVAAGLVAALVLR